MAIVKGQFTELLKVFEDECSPIRHFFARLRLCKHKGKYVDLNTYFNNYYIGFDPAAKGEDYSQIIIRKL